MPEVWVTVPAGRALHARPAAALARAAASFRCVIAFENRTNGRGPVNARSVVSLLSLGASAGAQLCISADGDDAAEALTALSLEFERLLEAEAPA